MSRKIANFYIEPESWDQFLINCRKMNSGGSEKLRELVREFNKNAKHNPIQKKL